MMLGGLEADNRGENVEPVWHQFVVRTRGREALRAHLARATIDAAVLYPVALRQLAQREAAGTDTSADLLAAVLESAQQKNMLAVAIFDAQGRVTEVLAEAFADGPQVAYVCGPEAMTRAVADVCAASRVACQVSLERLMACGIGACLSCVVTLRSGSARACVDGPVFDAEEVCWETSEIPPRH